MLGCTCAVSLASFVEQSSSLQHEWRSPYPLLQLVLLCHWAQTHCCPYAIIESTFNSPNTQAFFLLFVVSFFRCTAFVRIIKWRCPSLFSSSQRSDLPSRW
jgi:hypothetical protein